MAQRLDRMGEGTVFGNAPGVREHIGTESVAPWRGWLSLAPEMVRWALGCLVGGMAVGRYVRAVGSGDDTDLGRPCCHLSAIARHPMRRLEGHVPIRPVTQHKLCVGGDPEKGGGKPETYHCYGSKELSHGWVR